MPQIDGHTQLLGVFGHPIGHSLSPIMHNALLQAQGIQAVYLPLHTTPEHLSAAIAGFRALEFVGANVTLPFKEPVAKLVDELTPISSFMGSVNTLFWKGDKLCGTTTDPYGALQNLVEHNVNPAGRHVALLGNGGASRAIAFALLSPPAIPHCGAPASVTIFGRDARKLAILEADLRAAGLGETPVLRTALFDAFPELSKSVDLVINGTPVGMAPNSEESPLPVHALHTGMVVYDIVYAPMETRLLRDAKQAGCKTVGGIGMLIHQGALSFEHWFPGKSNVQIMRAALYAHLGVQV